MKYTFVTFFVILTAVFACKRPNCDHAQVRVMNIGTDTVEFGWDKNYFDGKIPPGESTYRTLSGISDGSFITTTFHSSKGDYSLTIDKCYEEFKVK